MPDELRVVRSDVGEASSPRGRAYGPGFLDELGTRRLTHGPPGEPTLEVFEFTPALAEASGFERALRVRVDALRDINELSLAAVRSVEHPEGSGLCLVSEHVPGRRLAELAPADLGAMLALDVIRTVTPVLGALNHAGVGVAHGALSASRIVVGADGRLLVSEHVLGWAIETLKFSRAQLNGLGIVVHTGDPVRFDGRTDMVQLGFLALSLWLRRHLDPEDCPDKVPELLDEAAALEDSAEFANGVRVWLERAMQIGPRPFTSAHDAIDALHELPDESDAPDPETETDFLAFRSEGPSGPKPATPITAESAAFDVAKLRATIEHRNATAEPPAAPAPRVTRPMVWILALLSVFAIGEAVALGLLVASRLTANQTASAVQPAVTPPSDPQPSLTSTTGSRSPGDDAVPAAGRESSNSSAPKAASVLLAAPRPTGERFGGLTIASALDFLVSADGTPVGPHSAPIALREGSHRLDFVNDELGFRQTRTVKVSYGQMTVVRVAMPTGRISINATPWADVMIDGEGVGMTPIASFALPIGTHEVVFRHPELGERHQTVVVKVGEYVRVTQTFDRKPGRSAR